MSNKVDERDIRQRLGLLEAAEESALEQYERRAAPIQSALAALTTDGGYAANATREQLRGRLAKANTELAEAVKQIRDERKRLLGRLECYR